MRRTLIIALLVLATVAAVPVALGAKPVREVFPHGEADVIPAGLGCSFDVGWQPSEDGRHSVTTFSDGRIIVIGHGQPTLTNLDTGTTFVNRSRYQITETTNEEGTLVFDTGAGRFAAQFYPGDAGIFGEVEEPGALLSLAGKWSSTFDLEAGYYTSFEFSGKATDICAVLDP